ncbi:hypothetical protein [Frankia sp. Cr1]|uniref:hypothetical protein n=1 Tax=Frankia sp. Cr1 TaxID=3073931 RepID=UPI002AD21038|nr:hypothetical protein [Frankia sp. Cr1]
MDSEHNELRIGSAVKVPLNDGAIWRFGWITRIDGDEITVDLGRDGSVTTTRGEIKRL